MLEIIVLLSSFSKLGLMVLRLDFGLGEGRRLAFSFSIPESMPLEMDDLSLLGTSCRICTQESFSTTQHLPASESKCNEVLLAGSNCDTGMFLLVLVYLYWHNLQFLYSPSITSNYEKTVPSFMLCAFWTSLDLSFAPSSACHEAPCSGKSMFVNRKNQACTLSLLSKKLPAMHPVLKPVPCTVACFRG